LNNKRIMKTFSICIDERIDQALDNLRKQLGKPSRAEVFRMAVALLKLAGEAKEKGHKLTICDQSDHIVKEIILPG
jgi:hypothetical protein